MNKSEKLKVIKLRKKRVEKKVSIEVRDLRDKCFLADDAFIRQWARVFGTATSMVYMALCCHVGSDQTTFPSIDMMAEEIAISRRHVIRGVKLLEFHNLIKVDRVKGQPNIYWLNDKRHWKRLVRVRKADEWR